MSVGGLNLDITIPDVYVDTTGSMHITHISIELSLRVGYLYYL